MRLEPSPKIKLSARYSGFQPAPPSSASCARVGYPHRAVNLAPRCDRHCGPRLLATQVLRLVRVPSGRGQGSGQKGSVVQRGVEHSARQGEQRGVGVGTSIESSRIGYSRLPHSREGSSRSRDRLQKLRRKGSGGSREGCAGGGGEGSLSTDPSGL